MSDNSFGCDRFFEPFFLGLEVRIVRGDKGAGGSFGGNVRRTSD